MVLASLVVSVKFVGRFRELLWVGLVRLPCLGNDVGLGWMVRLVDMGYIL